MQDDTAVVRQEPIEADAASNTTTTTTTATKDGRPTGQEEGPSPEQGQQEEKEREPDEVAFKDVKKDEGGLTGKESHQSRDDDNETALVRAAQGETTSRDQGQQQQQQQTETTTPVATTTTTTSIGTEQVDASTATATPAAAAAAAAAAASPASSTTPAPTTTTTTTPAPPPPVSKSPAPGTTITTKKFQSSLMVNKKFLEKAGDKAKPTSTGGASPEVKPIRPTPSALNATTSSTTATSIGVPRLLSGKISLTMGSASNSSSNSSALGNKNSSSSSSVAGGSGSGGTAPAPATTWTKTAVSTQPLPTPTSAPGGLTSEDRAFGRRGPGAFSSSSGGGGGGGGGRTDQPWIRGAPRSLHFGATEFPTAAEAANAKALRAQQILEQMQSRDRAIQARAAAAAKANAHLLEGLDAFRGVHLDPNASHWDEMGDEDDNFLDDTIEFADGTQYKISEVAAANNTASASNELKEPSPEEMGKLEAPLAPGEKVEEPSRQERFKDDFDRSYGGTRANDSSRRELISSSSALSMNSSSGALPTRTLFNAKEGRMEPTAPSSSRSSGPSTRRMSNDVVSIAKRGEFTSPRLEKASLPPTPATNPWGRVPPANAAPIATTTARRLSMNAGGERQLPPHMMQANQHQPAASTRSSVLSPPRAREPSLPLTNALAPSATATGATAPAPKEAISPPPVVESVEDLEARQAREMHAAAERARVRRQEEERERVAQVERAKKKAQELEERMKAAEEAKKPPVVAVKEEKKDALPAAKVDTWRRASGPNAPAASAAPKATAPPPAVTSPPIVRSEPIRILSREPKESAPPQVAITKVSSAAPVNESKSTSSASTSTPRVPLEPQDRAWRRADVPNGRGNGPPPPTTGYRQPPPHLLAQAANASKNESRATNERERRVSATAAGPVVTESKLAPAVEIKLGSSAKTTSPPQASTSPATTAAETTTSPRRGNRGQQQQQRETAQFDDLMSRVKNAMASPSSKDGSTEASPTTTTTGQDAPETVVTGSSPPRVKMPVIKLPSTGQNKQATSASAAASTAVPAAAPAGRNNRPSVKLPAQPAAAASTPAAPPKPAFEPREPRPMFERTARARSPSPGPAWRLYPVKLAAYPTPHRPAPRYKLHDFNDAMKPLRVALLTWNPPIQGLGTRRLSRDDYLHPKKYNRGVPQAAVQMPRKRIERRTEIEIVIVDRSKPKPAAPAVNGSTSLGETSRSATPSAFERGRGSGTPAGVMAAKARPSDGDHWRRPTPTKVDGLSPVDTTTAPSTAALFDPATPQHLTPPPPSSSGLPASQTDSMPSASSPFLSQVAASDRTRVVTGDLDGEEVQKTPRASLSAPGAERSEPTSLVCTFFIFFTFIHVDGSCSDDQAFTHRLQEKAKASFDATSSRVISATPSSPWPVGKAPLSLSALDPTASSLWAAPPSEPASHVRSMSLPRTRVENSLQGLGDDDYPSSIPMSLAELKSEDEGSPERTKVAQLPETSTPVPNNEPRLRAAAPSFSSFHTEHFAAHQAPGSQGSATPRFASIQRSVVTPSPGVEAYAYSPQLPTATLVGHSYAPAHYAAAAPHYASYSPVQQHQQLSQAQQVHYQGRTTYVPTSAASLYASGAAVSEYASVPTTTGHQQQQAYYRAQAVASAQQQQQSQQYHMGAVVNPTLVAAGYSTSTYGSDPVGGYGAVGGGTSRQVSSHAGVSAASAAGGVYATHHGYDVSPASRSSMYSPIPSSNRGYVTSSASSHYSHDHPRSDVSSSSYYGSTTTPSSTMTSSRSPYSHSRTVENASSTGAATTGSSFISGPISPVIMPQHLQPHAVHLVPSGSIGSAFPSTAGTGNRDTGGAQASRGGYGGMSSGARAVSAGVGGAYGGYQGHQQQQQAGTYRSQW